MSLTFPSLTPSPTGFVCAECRKFNFTEALKISMPLESQYPGHVVAGINLEQLSHFCYMCEEMSASLNNLEHFQLQSADSENYELRAFPIMIGTHTKEFCQMSNTIWLQLIPKSFDSLQGFDVFRVRMCAEQNGLTLCQSSSFKITPFHPQTLLPDFNATLVRQWIGACQERHPATCNSATLQTDILLIDCVARELCYFSHPPAYTALSYVWAKSALELISDTLKTSRNSFLPFTQSLPRVVKDAIRVTKDLGFQYLWVDKYCINQIDEATKKWQIDNMDLIYNSAELTLIAASGDDETYGLPGVSMKRTPPKYFTIGDFTIFHDPIDPNRSINRSQWSKRAWTFQEELLSRRRLFFLPEQVCFACWNMTCCESRGGAELCLTASELEQYSRQSLNFARQHRKTHFKSYEDNSSIHKSLGRSLGDLGEFINRYSGRILTFDADALRAFAGVKRVFELGDDPIGSLQGLPIPLSERLLPQDLINAHFFSVLAKFYAC